jgi:hypothetical protein
MALVGGPFGEAEELTRRWSRILTAEPAKMRRPALTVASLLDLALLDDARDARALRARLGVVEDRVAEQGPDDS